MLQTALKNARTPILLMGAGAVVLATIVATSISLSVQTAERSKQIVASRALRSAASEEMQTLLDAETGQRGYLLTGQREYLLPFQTARDRARSVLNRLEKLAAADPRIEKRVGELRPIAEDKLDELQSTVELFTAGRRADAMEVVNSGHGKAMMDAARSLLNTITDESEARVQDQLNALNRSVLMLRSLTVAGGVAIAIFVSFAIILLLRAVRDAVRARVTVEKLNATLEERVQNRTAALTQANDEIQRFAYIVSHDLRSPLVNVMGFTSELEVGTATLQKYFEAGDPAAADAAKEAACRDLPEAVKFIRSSTAKMDRLINAILKLSREGRRDLMPERIDLGKVFDAITASLAHQISETETKVEIAPDLPVLQTDRLAIEQIFGNIIDNALKYLQPGRPGHLTISSHEARGFVRISIADNGRGIAEHDLERVFELFRRAGKQDRAGEGIGLAHVRALVRRLGGDVTVRSKIGEGSEFRVLLPRILPKEQSAPS
ncbi:signal transduction histidine kinase [Rhizomicrobium palustre]|uniref:histidine kinase n=1 Tax=Rhizomicrobium palustre TaxID=189966 RepID=A0A846N2Q8_9PROT|nr:CHASE3 domain-containing protein [Rhizomicrobium palustre]NIK89581.1 signal transduction histidine kinase [Rhizomicrobium palustre]